MFFSGLFCFSPSFVRARDVWQWDFVFDLWLGWLQCFTFYKESSAWHSFRDIDVFGFLLLFQRIPAPVCLLFKFWWLKWLVCVGLGFCLSLISFFDFSSSDAQLMPLIFEQRRQTCRLIFFTILVHSYFCLLHTLSCLHAHCSNSMQPRYTYIIGLARMLSGCESNLFTLNFTW